MPRGEDCEMVLRDSNVKKVSALPGQTRRWREGGGGQLWKDRGTQMATDKMENVYILSSFLLQTTNFNQALLYRTLILSEVCIERSEIEKLCTTKELSSHN